jgi:hypothetical protein
MVRPEPKDEAGPVRLPDELPAMDVLVAEVPVGDVPDEDVAEVLPPEVATDTAGLPDDEIEAVAPVVPAEACTVTPCCGDALTDAPAPLTTGTPCDETDACTLGADPATLVFVPADVPPTELET